MTRAVRVTRLPLFLLLPLALGSSQRILYSLLSRFSVPRVFSHSARAESAAKCEFLGGFVRSAWLFRGHPHPFLEELSPTHVFCLLLECLFWL